MQTRKLICIICPRGCALEVTTDNNGAVMNISGNSCPRGAEYANNECTNPKRTVTTTIRCEDGGVVPVKTSVSIPKAEIFECMHQINKSTAKLPINSGDILLKDVCGSDIVATDSRK